MSRRLTTEEFINRAKEIHGDKYDYSNVVYVDNKTKVEILCPIHGLWLQTPDVHMHGRGCPQCYYDKKRNLVRGIGINDYKGRISEHGTLIPSYQCWVGMLTRCYDYKTHKKRSSYEDCYVCDEWKFFSNFKEWFDEHYVEGWHLDKDILVKGNKIYSPDKCCFVPCEINVLFVKSDKKRGKYPIGVSYCKERGNFYVAVSINRSRTFIGRYSTKQEAFEAYKKAKEENIKRIADKWKDKIDSRVYKAMYNYKVEVDD